MEHVPGNEFDLEFLDSDLDADGEAQAAALLGGEIHCPLCGHPYDHDARRVVRERDGLMTLAVQCHCCGTGSLVAVEHAQRPPVTELTAVERAFFAYLPPITEADVMRARNVLRAHRGDLRDLL